MTSAEECEHGGDPATCPPCQTIPGYAGPEVADCRSCGQPIIWTVTERGKRMPVDAWPGAGAFRLEQYASGPPVAIYGGGETMEERYTSHFATCPQSSEWRRG